MRRATIIFATALLAACATATPYQPLTKGQGYAEQKIEGGRYRISFAGNDLTPRQTVENYLLYRAAELTLQQGQDYFLMVEPSTEAQTTYTQHVNVLGSYGRYGWYPRSYLGAGLGASSAGSTEYEAQAYVLMRSGKKPEGDARAFDAREVKQNLEPLIQRPKTEDTATPTS